MHLYCPACSSLFLRANGNFVCWDSAGSDFVLQRYSDTEDHSRIYHRNGPCFEIAKRLRKGNLPNPDVCPGCLCLTAGPNPVFRSSSIDVLQVEPSARCTLRCKGCASDAERDRLVPPLDLSPEVFDRILGDFSSAGISISCFDFSGHGEPFMNPKLHDLISIARSRYSKSHIIVLTNGQHEFEPSVVESGADEIHVAIDGSDQASYEQYRVGGSFEKAFRFLSQLAEADVPGKPRSVWRYVLFRHNDNVHHVSSVWRMATKNNIDQIVFIFTSIGESSRRICKVKYLETLLSEAGVPNASMRLSKQSDMRRRRYWSELLRRLPVLHAAGRRIFRNIVSRKDGNDLPVVVADFCRIDPEQLRRFLEMGIDHVRSNRYQDAAAILKHVDRLVEMPGRTNPEYDMSEVLEQLGDSYHDLREQLVHVAEQG